MKKEITQIAGIPIYKDGNQFSFTYRNKSFSKKSGSEKEKLKTARKTIIMEALRNDDEETFWKIHLFAKQLKESSPEKYKYFLKNFKTIYGII